jgi:hypothetical protein
LQESNFAAALDILGGEGKNLEVLRCGHWACGWMEYIAIKARNKKGFTSIFRKALDICNRLDNYPVLDEDDFSRREYEEYQEFVESEFSGFGRFLESEVNNGENRLKPLFASLENENDLYEFDDDFLTEEQKQVISHILIGQCFYCGECYIDKNKALQELIQDENFKVIRDNSNNPEFFINPDQTSLEL